VREGLHVKAGEVLFVLSSERSSPITDASQQAITHLLQNRRDSLGIEVKQSQQQAKQRMAATRDKVSELSAESGQLEQQLSLQKERLALAEQSYQRHAELQAKNFLSPAQLQDKQSEVLEQRRRLADIARQQTSVKRSWQEAQAQLLDQEILASRDQQALARNAAALGQEIVESEARREILVRAPTAGRVTAIAAANGQAVTAGSTLATLLPAGSLLEAEVYAPSRAIGFIRPGMRVQLRYQAFAYQKFGQQAGTVREVAEAALTPQELGLTGVANQATEPLYRIRLSLDKQTIQAYGKATPLKSGMLLDTSIELERRRLYEWVMEPLFSISGRL
jgi:membrane fusion protein